MSTTVTLPYNDQVAAYERWFDEYPNVFSSELNAIRELLPRNQKPEGLEIGVATGRFAQALKIQHGTEPAGSMCDLALKRGVHAINAVPEDLPYKAMNFDFVLMNFCMRYFTNPAIAFAEAWRVLKYEGCLIIGFLEKESPEAKKYQQKTNSSFFKRVKLYSTGEVTCLLDQAGFKVLEFSQTHLHGPGQLTRFGDTQPGYCKGSYVLVKATKQPPD